MFFYIEIKVIFLILLFFSFRHKISNKFNKWYFIVEAHFYHPIDDSLPEKAKAYQEAFKAWQNIEASFHFYDQQGWEDRLGDKQELQSAMNITQNTLDKAMNSFSREELLSLSDQKILSYDELELLESKQQHYSKDTKESIIETRKKEIAESRAKSSHSRDRDMGINR